MASLDVPAFHACLCFYPFLKPNIGVNPSVFSRSHRQTAVVVS